MKQPKRISKNTLHRQARSYLRQLSGIRMVNQKDLLLWRWKQRKELKKLLICSTAKITKDAKSSSLKLDLPDHEKIASEVVADAEADFIEEIDKLATIFLKTPCPPAFPVGAGGGGGGVLFFFFFFF